MFSLPQAMRHEVQYSRQYPKPVTPDRTKAECASCGADITLEDGICWNCGDIQPPIK